MGVGGTHLPEKLHTQEMVEAAYAQRVPKRKLGSALLNLGEEKKSCNRDAGNPQAEGKYEGKGTKLLIFYLVFLTRLHPAFSDHS